MEAPVIFSILLDTLAGHRTALRSVKVAGELILLSDSQDPRSRAIDHLSVSERRKCIGKKQRGKSTLRPSRIGVRSSLLLEDRVSYRKSESRNFCDRYGSRTERLSQVMLSQLSTLSVPSNRSA